MTDLYTIGYQGAAQDALLHTLLYNDIQTLLDIRELPLSRKPGFSKTALGNAAENSGIRYVHVRALGTPRDLRYQRKIDHDEDAFRAGYLAHLATDPEAGAALDALITRVPQERCCLLCYEADFRECHRLLVTDQIVERTGGTVTVTHLQIGQMT